MLMDIFLFSVCFAAGQFFIYALLAERGGLVVSMVTTTRKFFTILLSVMVFNPGLLDERQWLGVFMVFSGLAVDLALTHR